MAMTVLGLIVDNSPPQTVVNNNIVVHVKDTSRSEKGMSIIVAIFILFLSFLCFMTFIFAIVAVGWRLLGYRRNQKIFANLGMTWKARMNCSQESEPQ